MSWSTCRDKKRKHQRGRACRGRKQCASPARVVAHGATAQAVGLSPLCLSGTSGRLAVAKGSGSRGLAPVSWSRRPRSCLVRRLGRWVMCVLDCLVFPRGTKQTAGRIGERALQRRGGQRAAGRLLALAAAAVRTERRGVAACAVQDPGSDLAWPAGRTYVPGGRVVGHYILRTASISYRGRSLGRWQGEYLAGTGDLSLLTSPIRLLLRALPSSANNRMIRRRHYCHPMAISCGTKQTVWYNAFFVSVRSNTNSHRIVCPLLPLGNRTDKPRARTTYVRTAYINARMYMLHAGKCTTHLCYFNTSSLLYMLQLVIVSYR
jgi:hypothetical protein